MNEDLVVLYSGGADSTLLLKLATEMGKKPFAVMIDYQQLHIEELEIAKQYLDKNKIENMTIKIFGYNVNSALTGNGEIGLYKDVSVYNVPARNTIFLSLAAGIAESKKIQEIWIGCDMSDFYGKFVDCTQSYIGKINELFHVAFSYPINVKAPLLGFTKEMVLNKLRLYGISKDQLYSGYGEIGV